MCPELAMNKNSSKDVNIEKHEEVHSKLSCSSKVLLQTLSCVVRNGERQKRVRALLDSGSQRSYILEKTAEELHLMSKGEVQLCHLLFDGLKQTR
jgi:hypothetical protein